MLGDKVLTGGQIGGESYAAMIGVLAMTCDMDMDAPARNGDSNRPSEENCARILQDVVAGNLSVGEAVRLLRLTSALARSS